MTLLNLFKVNKKKPDGIDEITQSLKFTIETIINENSKQNEIIERHSFYNFIIDSMPIMLWVIDERGKTIFANRRYKDCKLCIEPPCSKCKNFIATGYEDGKYKAIEIWQEQIESNGEIIKLYSGVDVTEKIEIIKRIETGLDRDGNFCVGSRKCDKLISLADDFIQSYNILEN